MYAPAPMGSSSQPDHVGTGDTPSRSAHIIMVCCQAAPGLPQKWIMRNTGENLSLTSIRGVAAAWVVAYHVQPLWFPRAPGAVASGLLMGYAAVDIFFVLSGFILAQVYGVMRAGQLPMFWLRRICRIYPLHLAVMATVPLAILVASALRGAAHPSDWISFGAVTLLLQSFLLDDSPWNPPSWSLGVELLCYAIFPLTIRFLARAPGLLLVGVAMALALAEAAV